MGVPVAVAVVEGVAIAVGVPMPGIPVARGVDGVAGVAGVPGVPGVEGVDGVPVVGVDEAVGVGVTGVPMNGL